MNNRTENKMKHSETQDNLILIKTHILPSLIAFLGNPILNMQYKMH